MEPNERVGVGVGVGGSSSLPRRRSSRGASIESLDRDILSMIFSFLHSHFDIARCSSVCKSWYDVLNTSLLLKMQYCKQQEDSSVISNVSSSSGTTLKKCLEEWALKQHRLSLQAGSVDVYQWNCHSAGVDQCRMKMGSIATGVGDKVVRIWSLQNYKCLEEYFVPDMAPLADFDFDESKIVGLVGARICIWRRQGKRSIFPSREDKSTKGLCIRYIDPEAVVGCGDGTVRVFDMYSQKCSHIIRTHTAPVTCLALTDDQLVVSGSSLGGIKLAGLSSDQRVASLKSTDLTGIRSLCYNLRSSLVFAGSTSGFVHCWDLRMMKPLWEKRVSPNVVYSVQHMRNDTSSLVTGGIDGVLRILDQDTGEFLSSYVSGKSTVRESSANNRYGVLQKYKAIQLPEDHHIDSVPKTRRSPITCLAVGMKKVITTHNSKFIQVWKFNK